MKRSTVLILVSTLVILIFPVLCMSQPKYGGKLVYAIAGDPPTIDFHKSTSGLVVRTAAIPCNNLVESGADWKPKPALATSWNLSGNGLEWTFQLRKGVKFHNGREMTSEDIKWNFDRIMDPKTGSPFKGYFFMLDAVKVIDRYTVKFILNRPWGAFIGIFSGVPYQSVIMAPESVNKDGSITHPIGTGPFEFVEWKPGDYLKFKKFKDYWEKGIPYLDEVILKPVADETVRLAGIRTGDLDVAYRCPIAQVLDLMKKPQKDFHFDMDARGGNAFICINQSKPPLNDVRVRQAVAYGINKEEMLKGVYFGHGWVVNQMFTEDSPWYCDVPKIVQNKERAKALLKEAGYPNGLKLTCVVNTGYSYVLLIGQIMQAQLKDVGIEIKLDIVDVPTYFKKLGSAQYDFSVLGFAEYGDPDLAYRSLLTPKGAWAYASNGYDNPQMTELLDKAGAALDFNKRKELYCNAIKILQQECPVIFAITGRAAYGVRNVVKGLKQHPADLMRYADGGLQYAWLDK